MRKFYGRDEELAVLEQNERQSNTSATFTVIVGRRRVGKTTLLQKSLEGRRHVYLFIGRENEAMLCRRLQQDIEQALELPILGMASSFADLFEILMKASITEHFSVVLDEFQNFVNVNPSVFGQIQNIWDKYHRQSKMNLIVCGSIHRMMKQIFDNPDEPLYGRATSRLFLRPFTTHVVKNILADHNPSFSSEDLLCLYMISGGVAKYVSLLMDAGAVTQKEMIDFVCRADSYFFTEGQSMISDEFGKEFETYFAIMQMIASGMTKQSEICGLLGKNVGTYLHNLDAQYELIYRRKPLLSKPNSRNLQYGVRDNFMRFWFHFIYPNISLIERGRVDLLRNRIEKDYTQFSGITLERYFHDKIGQTSNYTQIGAYWDRKGVNEIDLMAIDESNHTGLAAEIKRNPNKYNPMLLQQKVDNLPAEFARYKWQIQCLSMGDM